MKRRQKLAILKFMIYKRKRQQLSQKKKVDQVNIEKDIPKTVDNNVSKTTNIIASSLKITFNSAQKIGSISLYYHQQHKPAINTKHSLVTSHHTDNKLNLLIEAVNFIEMYKDNGKVPIQSIE